MALWTLWDTARKGAGLPAYTDVHIESMEDRIAWTTIYLWKNRETLTDFMIGSELARFAGVDPSGSNVLDVIHESRRREASEAFELIATGPCAGIGEFSAQMKSGLSVIRQTLFLPIAAPDPATKYIIGFTRHLVDVDYEPDDRLVELGATHFKVAMFPLRDLGL